ncbi:hypothetical protein Bca52824_044762 [Brassica carinata]|uniref:Small ribosomal subunit protein uS5 n=1 Tax=Brassica carinata TaxID=52824 RepID=A0A8X7R9F1_BRACI|nr:hypothetical protein Bca52824_044762 [Brassica carinata]
MAERGGERGAGDRGGFGRGFGGGRGDRGGRGGPRGRGNRRGGRPAEEEKWTPVTKLGRLVKEGKIQKLEQIYLHSLPVHHRPPRGSHSEKIMPQKQTRAGGATAIIGEAVCDSGERVLGNKIGKPHTVPCKVTGKCGSVTVRMVPAPRGAGIVAARVPKKVLQFAGIDDVFTSSRGRPKLLETSLHSTASRRLTDSSHQSSGETSFKKSPYQEYTDLLAAKETTSKAITEVEDQA